MLVHYYVYSESDVGQLEFASYYSSNMVLQRAPTRPVIWGYAIQEGDTVILNIDQQNYTVNASTGMNK